MIKCFNIKQNNQINKIKIYKHLLINQEKKYLHLETKVIKKNKNFLMMKKKI